tara:strand:+ start:60 stop:296 length:237 start_codon:yes stop_codon:yes gene_type:complete
MITLNKDGTPRKRGSGKTKGSTSFESVTLSVLKSIVKDGVPIPVSRKWLKTLGVEVGQPAEEEVKEEGKVEFSFTEFE